MDWHKKIDEGLNQSLNASKKLIDKAREKAKKLGDKSLLAFEINEMEKEHEQLIKNLGEIVSSLFLDDGRTSVSTRTVEIKPVLERLKEIEAALDSRRSHPGTE